MLDIDAVRAQFPALNRPVDGRPPVFLDGPGGTQVPRRVVDAVGDYLSAATATTAASSPRRRASDRILDEAHAAVADLLGAPSPDEVVFGQNMTTLTFHMSRSRRAHLEARRRRLRDPARPRRQRPPLGVRRPRRRGRGPLHRPPRRRHARPRRLRPEDRRGEIPRADLRQQRAGHDARRGRPHGAGPRRRGAGLPRRGPLRPARPHRRARLGLRLPRLLGVQVLRPARRRPVGAARTAREPARLQGPPRDGIAPRPVDDRHAEPRGHRRHPRRRRLPRIARAGRRPARPPRRRDDRHSDLRDRPCREDARRPRGAAGVARLGACRVPKTCRGARRRSPSRHATRPALEVAEHLPGMRDLCLVGQLLRAGGGRAPRRRGAGRLPAAGAGPLTTRRRRSSGRWRRWTNLRRRLRAKQPCRSVPSTPFSSRRRRANRSGRSVSGSSDAARRSTPRPPAPRSC